MHGSFVIPVLIASVVPHAASAQVGAQGDREVIANLDLAYQAAVKRNDADEMDRILHRDFALVLGSGRVVSRDQLLAEARSGSTRYQVQDEDPGTQMVRLWGDTAVVTARLRVKGERRGEAFDHTLWFSDTYVRTAEGWKYAFAQASLPLPSK